MKKNVIFLILLVCSISSFSQSKKPITKGNIFIQGGGTVQYQRDKFLSSSISSKTSSYFISFTPGAGYFIIDNLAIGLNTNIYYNGTTNNKFYSLGIGPMTRYYFNNGIFLEADAAYSILNYISSTASTEKYLSVIGGLGYAFFLNPKLSLEPALYYEFDNINLNISNTHKINSFRLELRLSVFI
jgi:hypothetical protein